MKILLIEGGKAFGHSHGQLNRTLYDEARAALSDLGHTLLETEIDQGYEAEEEVEKFLWADAVIYQMPGWWMGPPWIVKRYVDEVFTYGHGRLYANDGRHRVNPTKNYGKGGLLQGKKYLFSLTWNAPAEAFDDPDEFFGGIGVDGVYGHFHKAHEFLGMQALPTYIAHDVIKNPEVETFKREYRAHLHRVFG